MCVGIVVCSVSVDMRVGMRVGRQAPGTSTMEVSPPIKPAIDATSAIAGGSVSAIADGSVSAIADGVSAVRVRPCRCSKSPPRQELSGRCNARA